MAKSAIIFVISILVISLVVAAGCGGDDETEPSGTPEATLESTGTPSPTSTPSPTPEQLYPSPTPLPIITANSWGAMGDVNIDGVVDSVDLDLIAAAIGTDNYDDDWNAELDLNMNNKVNAADLAIAGRSCGATHSFHFTRPLSNREKYVSKVNVAIDAIDRLHVVWAEGSGSSRGVYYTRLDRFGNTLIDDLLLDSSAGAGDDGVGIGCDAAGNAHIVWNCHNSGDLCQARVDQWGHLLSGGEEDCILDSHSTDGEPGVAVDSIGRAHISYALYQKHVYTVVTASGTPMIWGGGFRTKAWMWPTVVADAEDNVHWLYVRDAAGPDALSYGRYSFGDMPSLSEREVTSLLITGWAGYYRQSMAVDSNGNVFILWPDKREGSMGLYLEKLAPDGSTVIDDYLLWDGFHSYGASNADIAVDGSGNIHVISPGCFDGTASHLAYGIFDNEGEVISPMEWVVYGSEPMSPRFEVDSHGDAHLFYLNCEQLTCDSKQICYQSTAFDPAAYDRTRPDLGVDVAHLYWSPFLARWGRTLTIDATVFNTGWTDSPAATARFEIMLSDDTALPTPLVANATIPALAPGETHAVQVELTLPMTPPEGYEAIEYVRLQVQVDPDDIIAETTEANNQINVPMMVQPLPTVTGLFLIVKDITATAYGGDEIPLNIGVAHLTGPEMDRTIEITDYGTVLARDIPIATEPTAYTVTWQAQDYRIPEAFMVSIGRNPSDPYVIDYDPANTALLETDNWGSLSGTISNQEGNPIAGATVRIVGQNLNIRATTNLDGNFSPETEPKLDKMIPGSYAVYLSAANYARISGNVTIGPLDDVAWNQTMEPTTKAYVCGVVYNEYGRPVANADINACGLSQSTAPDGSFDLGEVEASCTQLQVSKNGYASVSESMTLTAGLEEYFGAITLEFDPPVSIVQDEGSLASWEQDESSGDLLPDPPDDANWLQEQAFDLFSSKFWPTYRIQVWWGTYEYYLDAMYTGPTSDRHLYEVQLRLVPKTFEAHRVSGKGSMKVFGQTVKLEISRFEDSGQTTALRVIEARLVDTDSGDVIKTVSNPIEGGGYWDALTDTTRTYDFGGVEVEDWNNAEVWLYIKVGKNENGAWTDSPILRGWRYDQQALRFDLDNPEETHSDYVLADFPIP